MSLRDERPAPTPAMTTGINRDIARLITLIGTIAAAIILALLLLNRAPATTTGTRVLACGYGEIICPPDTNRQVLARFASGWHVASYTHASGWVTSTGTYPHDWPREWREIEPSALD